MSAIKKSLARLATTLLLLAGMATLGPARAAEPAPVVLVFPIEFSGVRLTKVERTSLADYLSTRLGEGGRLQMVPRESLRRLLTEQKAESYKSCYDRSCQIELGRELAAQLTVATKIGRVGTGCVMSAALYDLKKAATVAAATARSSCDADALLAAVDGLATKLLEQVARRATAPAATAPVAVPNASGATRPQSLLAVDSEPQGAQVSVNGQVVAQTPVSLRLPAGEIVTLRLSKEGYQEVERTVMPGREQVVRVNLAMTGQERKRLEQNRNEWIGLDLLLGYDYDGFAFGVVERFFVLKWKYFFWCIIEGQATVSPGSDSSLRSMFAGTRVGLPLYLGRQGRHQLRLGLGAGICLLGLRQQYSSGQSDTIGCLVPSVRYVWQSNSWFHAGVGLRLLVPLKADPGVPPLQFYVSVPLGWSAGI